MPPVLEGHVEGFRRWTVVDEGAGAVHTGFGIGEMEPGGRLDWHVHSYEESLYVVDGEVVLFTSETAVLLGAGDYALIPLGQAHALANRSSATARWAALSAPVPRAAHGGDTYFVPALPEMDPIAVDARDPRTRSFGNIQPGHMDPGRQGQELLTVSASMRSALLVYSGITVKMMIDSDLGAQLSTMFMVQYDARKGVIGGHDHPLEETYLILRGRGRRDVRRRVVPHGPRRRGVGGRRVRPRVREPGRRAGPVARDAVARATRAPLVPVRARLGLPAGHDRGNIEGGSMTDGAVVVVGGTAGLGKEVARHYAQADREVVITGRDPTRGSTVAAELGGKTTELAFDLSKPKEIAPALEGVGDVSRLVLAGVHRDLNTMRSYDIDEAIALVTLKLVGYTEVVHALLDRLHDDSSILIFGGLAKERPYPGSMTVTTINHGVDGLVRSLTAELKPIRVNALHPGIVEDSPFWAGKTEALDAHRNRTTTGRLVQMQEVVDVAVLMLENLSIAGAEFRVDAGWSMPY